MEKIQAFSVKGLTPFRCQGNGQIVKSRATKDIIRRTKVETETGTRIDEGDLAVNVLLRNPCKVAALREEEAKDAVHVLVGAPLPRLFNLQAG